MRGAGHRKVRAAEVGGLERRRRWRRQQLQRRAGMDGGVVAKVGQQRKRTFNSLGLPRTKDRTRKTQSRLVVA